MSTKSDRKRRLQKQDKAKPRTDATQEALDHEANVKLTEAGMSALDIEIAVTTQKILRTDSHDRSQADAILAAVSAEVRAGVVKHFRTTETLRELFPEFAAMFELVN